MRKNDRLFPFAWSRAAASPSYPPETQDLGVLICPTALRLSGYRARGLEPREPWV
jgi:hypothetical protein